MTTTDTRTPATTAWGLVGGAVVGTAALAAFEPLVVVGAGCGAFLPAIVGWFQGSYRRVALAAALFPSIVAGGLLAAALAVGLRGEATAGVMIALGIVIGIGVTNPWTHSDPRAIERLASSALAAGVVAVSLGGGALGVAALGGPGSTIETLRWVPGAGTGGFLLAIVLTALGIGFGIAAAPPGAFVTPRYRGSYEFARTVLLWWTGILAGIVVVGTAAMATLSWLVPWFGVVLDPIVTSGTVRLILVGVTVLGVIAGTTGLVVRHLWAVTKGRENATVPVLLGSSLGVGTLFAGVVLAGVESGGSVGTTFTVLALGFVGISIGLWWIRHVADRTPSAGAILGFGLVAGGVVTGASVEAAAGPLETLWPATPTLVAIAAGLFAYEGGRYGSALATEVGRDGATPQPQYVRLGWSAVVAAIGVPVAVLALLVALVLAPTLSVPATAALGLALVTIVVGGWLLFR